MFVSYFFLFKKHNLDHEARNPVFGEVANNKDHLMPWLSIIGKNLPRIATTEISISSISL